VIVQPATVVRWHRLRFRLYWRFKVAIEVRKHIGRISKENPLWGAPWIRDELVWVDQDTGYRCAILRHPTLCGYVHVPEEHLLHGMGTSDRVEMLRDNVELHDQAPDFMGMLCEALDPEAQDGTVPISSAILAHGGVSFAGDLSGRIDQPRLAG